MHPSHPHHTPATSALRYLSPPGLYDATTNAYSHGVSVTEPLRWLWISGQGGENAEGQLPASFAEQADQALCNLQTALADGGATLSNVLKLTVLIVDYDAERFAQWKHSVLRHWGAGEPGDPRPRFPACTLIPVSQLALPGMLIEVDATAAVTAAHPTPLRP